MHKEGGVDTLWLLFGTQYGVIRTWYWIFIIKAKFNIQIFMYFIYYNLYDITPSWLSSLLCF